MTRKVFRVRVDLSGKVVDVRAESKNPRGSMYALRSVKVPMAGVGRDVFKESLRQTIERIIAE